MRSWCFKNPHLDSNHPASSWKCWRTKPPQLKMVNRSKHRQLFGWKILDAVEANFSEPLFWICDHANHVHHHDPSRKSAPCLPCQFPSLYDTLGIRSPLNRLLTRDDENNEHNFLITIYELIRKVIKYKTHLLTSTHRSSLRKLSIISSLRMGKLLTPLTPKFLRSL